MNRSPFTDEIEQTEALQKFNPSHFTLFKGDKDPDKHLMHYRSAMTLYANDDILMCKNFTTTLQGEAQDWFHTYHHDQSGTSVNFPWFSLRNIHLTT
ncbi:hypothetical protein EV1_022299 [Malus domestica]